jgi:hypothetical protein
MQVPIVLSMSSFLSRKRWNCITFRRWTQRGVWIRVCCIIIRFWWWSIMIKALSFRLKQLPSLHPRGAKHWSPTWKLDRLPPVFRCSFLCLFEYFNGLWAWKPSKEIRKFIRSNHDRFMIVFNKNDIILGLNPWHLRQDLYVEWLQFFWCR